MNNFPISKPCENNGALIFGLCGNNITYRVRTVSLNIKPTGPHLHTVAQQLLHVI